MDQEDRKYLGREAAFPHQLQGSWVEDSDPTLVLILNGIKRRPFHLLCAVELIEPFPSDVSAKNGDHIKLCLDAAMDISRFAHIGSVIIVGGAIDFMPVAQKIRSAGHTYVGIGDRRNANKYWA